MSLLRATRSQVLLLLAGLSLAALPIGPDAGAQQAVEDWAGLARRADGWLRLAADAGRAPQSMGAFERFGMWDSPAAKLDAEFQSVLVQYRSEAPAGTERFIAVRASRDGAHWSEWEWDVAEGATDTFDTPQRWIQHRVVLTANAGRTPMVSDVKITPRSAPAAMLARDLAMKSTSVAPTYRLRVTRQGMVGSRTANGHVVRSHDFFVSLPSWRVLSSRGGDEYMVRLSANGKSVVVPVWDVGPWNMHDNFWDADRAKYKNLPVGWPEDHAAYYEHYNHGRAEKGRVRFPTAVDVGDGAYWALDLADEQATVDVTFLWLGDDPGPRPVPRNTAPARRPERPAP